MKITLPLLKCCSLFFLLQTSAFVSAACLSKIPETTDHLVDHYNGTVSDPQTGLMWKKCVEGRSYNSITNGCSDINNASTVFSWDGALIHAGFVNSGLVGERFSFFNWRVPNKKELHSIVERRCSNPSINESVFVTPSTATYWSSSVFSDDTSKAWYVYFGTGNGNPRIKSTNHHLRLVRYEQ